MRVFRLLLAAIIGLVALIMGGFVALLVILGGLLAVILTRLGLARGHFKVNVQRGTPTRPAGAARINAQDAIDVEVTRLPSDPPVV